MVNGWKVTAIIFMTLFILETAFLIWGVSLANESIEKENECVYNICQDYDSYLFDEYENICYCYIGDELIHWEYLSNG